MFTEYLFDKSIENTQQITEISLGNPTLDQPKYEDMDVQRGSNVFYAAIVLNLVKGSLTKLRLSDISPKCQFTILKNLKKLTDLEVELSVKQVKQTTNIVQNLLSSLNTQTTLTIKIKDSKVNFTDLFDIVRSANEDYLQRGEVSNQIPDLVVFANTIEFAPEHF